ncbi:hypothetical protein [Brucella anthropi]|uniref:hypothetical protein n=1 Tax=Brucella anthropi TaxID=529 RepID=UPI00125D4104|nr:hypothetical protein [Brucella anthropi]QFP63330.1 hypothetical protein FT787_09555 [Brucella anthropi]
MTPVELKMLQHIFKASGPIPIGEITLTMGISIKDASSAFRSLKREGLLDAPNGMLALTKAGRDWIMSNQALFAFSNQKNWRTVPEEYVAQKIKPFQPYAPRLSQLSKKFL